MGRTSRFKTEEERIEAKKLSHQKYRKSPKGKANVQNHIKNWHTKNPNKVVEYDFKQNNKWGSGVYGIFSNGLCLYIGESVALYRRFQQHKTCLKHPTTSHNPELYIEFNKYKHIYMGVIEETSNHKEKEIDYIRQYQPLLNRYHNG